MNAEMREKCAEIRAVVTEYPSSIDPEVVVEQFFDPSGGVAGLKLGMTLDEVTGLGFSTTEQGAEHVGFVGPGIAHHIARHDVQFTLEDKVLEFIEYTLTAESKDVIAVETQLSEALEDLVGPPIVVHEAKHWMFGDDAQFILEHRLGDDGESPIEPDEVLTFNDKNLSQLSLRLWSGEEGEFPGAFDPTGVEQLVRDFVDATYGDQIKLGSAEIWMEDGYVYFNLIVEEPEDEIDVDWDGVPVSGDVLLDDFQEVLKEAFDVVLDL